MKEGNKDGRKEGRKGGRGVRMDVLEDVSQPLTCIFISNNVIMREIFQCD